MKPVDLSSRPAATGLLRALRDGRTDRAVLVPEPFSPGPAGRHYTRTVALAHLGDDAIAVVDGLAGELLAPWSRIVVRPDGDGWAVDLESRWSDPAKDAEEIAWTRAAVAELAAFTS